MTILLQFAVWLNSVLTKVEEIIQKQGLRKEKTGVIFEGIIDTYDLVVLRVTQMLPSAIIHVNMNSIMRKIQSKPNQRFKPLKVQK